MRRTMAVLAALALTTTACSQRAPESAGPRKEVVVACGAAEDWCQKMTAGFTAKTGIPADYVRLSSGEAVARFGASRDNPEFDVWHGGPADGYEAAKDQGLLQAYASSATGKIPARYRDPAGYWTGVYIGALGFCSNRDVLAKAGLEPPRSWDDLLAPGFAKQVAIAHPATSGTAYTALYTVVQLKGGEAAGLRYFQDFGKSVLQYSKSGSAPGQMAGRGEVATGVVFSHDCVKYQEEGSTSLVVTYPREGTGYEVGAVGILARARNLDAAKAYVDYAASATAQEIGPTVKSYQRPTSPDATPAPQAFDPMAVRLVDYDIAAAGKAKKGLIEQFESGVATAPAN
ncbi:ABC transporter substrate-binding protein [Umezawaea tangerina]|uniref:Iron(III) transport system substrate-binding protein n=1 Tax=Umezawaea tangerina TaxID=84725 RepID=A0A2T0TAZ3_9PSEU|nr:ABC transporter substrate-binding protein [Umezawaea tangerina]PRY42836.1 iron(III) transport system substrate-binding protein [Umezawaea tangerina]